MTTWHQRCGNHAPLWHETKHTVVEDPPGGCLTASRFESPEEAQTYLNNLTKNGKGRHCYILPPMKMRANHV